MKADEIDRLLESAGIGSQPTSAVEAVSDSRLEELRLQVEAGSYEVSSAELASKIVDTHTKA